MPAAGQDCPDNDRDAVPITARALLVVEGRDEQLFLERLIEDQGWTGVQVRPIGGKTRLSDQLDALYNTSGFPDVRGLAIVRDANSDPVAAFQSVCAALQANRLPVPAAPLEWTGDSPVVAVMIVPGESEPGSLEDLCLASAQQDPAIPCVESYFECLSKMGLPVPRNLSKAKVQVLLASKPKTYLRVGEAACAGYWSFDSPSFKPLREIIQKLVSVATAEE